MGVRVKKPAKKSRLRLPAQPPLLMDAKLVNLMRYHRMLTKELKKPRMSFLRFTSMMGELHEVQGVMAERFSWLFNKQYPVKRFDWGSLRKNSTLPDEMPEILRPEKKLSSS
jgi:hypothetical protein